MIREQIAENIVRITLDERFYKIDLGKGDVRYLPSVTSILDHYPKGIGFQKYLVSLGDWEQGRKILKDAGERGGKVHAGIEQLIKHKKLHIEDIPAGHYEPFTGEEWQLIKTFTNWHKRYKPIYKSVEAVVYSLKDNYAGTIDIICDIDRGLLHPKKPQISGVVDEWVLDWKTSSNIYESYKCQLAAYVKADKRAKRFGIVRLGSRHKVGYEFWQNGEGDLAKYYKLFKSVQNIWDNETPNKEPKQIDIEETLTLLEDEENETNDKKKN